MKVSVDWAPPLRVVGKPAQSQAQLLIEDRREGVTPAGPSPVERAVTLSLDNYCSVAGMVKKTADLSYDVVLDEG